MVIITKLYIKGVILVAWVIFFIILISFFVIMFYLANKSVDKDIRRKNDIKSLFTKPDYQVQHYFIDDEGRNGIGIDKQNNLILVNNYNSTLSSKTIKPFDIMEVEIIEDGKSIIKASRGSQIGGALVGGLLAGTAGMIIGGLSSNKSKSTKVNTINLRLTIKDIDNPMSNVTFLNKGFPIDTEKAVYKLTYDRALQWQKRIEILMSKSNEVVNE